MDENPQSNSEPTSDQQIDVTRGGDAESPVSSPNPGEVITGSKDSGSPSAYGAGPAGGAPPKVVTSGKGGGKRWLKMLVMLIVLTLVAVGGWYAYTKYIKKAPATSTTQSKDIPLLKIGIQQADYGNLYPDMSQNDYAISVNGQMFEGLVRYENKSKIQPDLASGWTNPDDNTWIFTIKKGIKFHDGHTLAPSDVKYSLDAMVASDSGLAQAFADTIASVDVLGNNQVKITTKSPDPTLLNKLTFLYIIDANLPKGDEPSLAGTGPYEIKPGTKPTDKSYQMVAFNQYHFGRPTTRALTFGNQDNNTGLIKLFNSGQYDIAGTIAPASIKQAKNATVFEANEADSTFIGFNTITASPVQNKLVREAIRYAVNTQGVGKANEEVITPNSQVVPPAIPGYNPAIAPYKQNIEKAKQLLAQAGYPNGVTIRMSVSSADIQEATELANELKQAGITLNIDQHSDFDEFISYFAAGKADMYVIDYASDTIDGVDVYNTTLPVANYNNPKVTALLDQANTTINPATRLKLLQEVGTIVDQDVALVPLGSTSSLWAMNQNYVIQQDTPTGYIPVYFYKVHLR
jgi:peptide/nickel transport system substrate-binding protein